MELFFMVFGALFSVMNPLGTVPIFTSLTTENTNKERQKIALKTSLNVLVILLISFFVGDYLLNFFGITLNALKIAGGLIITTSGFALLTGEFTKHKGMKRDGIQKDIATREEISLTPLALPMIAGPGTISLLITYNKEYFGIENVIIIVIAMFMVTLIIFLILNSSQLIVKLLGASGINALSRIIGFIVIALGIEFIISAVSDLLIHLKLF
jgi:multiple antibiotic resistance protein